MEDKRDMSSHPYSWVPKDRRESEKSLTEKMGREKRVPSSKWDWMPSLPSWYRLRACSQGNSNSAHLLLLYVSAMKAGNA